MWNSRAKAFQFDYDEAYVLNDWSVESNGGYLLPVSIYIVDGGLVIARPDPTFDPSEKFLVYESLRQFQKEWSDVPFVNERADPLDCYEAAIEGALLLTEEETDPDGWALLHRVHRAALKNALKAFRKKRPKSAKRKPRRRESAKR